MSDSSIITLELKNKKTVTGKLESYENKLIELTDAHFMDDGEITYRIFIKEKDISKILNNDEQNIIRMPEGVKDWNQFEANERLFGIKPEFNESDYTTVLDKNSEFYLKNVAKAKKIEHDILTAKCSDRHRMEERGLISCENEEDRYSAVLHKKKGRKNGKSSKKGEKETERVSSDGEKKKNISHVGEKKIEKENGKKTSTSTEENTEQDVLQDKTACHETDKTNLTNGNEAHENKSCEDVSDNKASKEKEDTKGPISLKGVSYKKNVSSTFKTIREYIESITSKFTGSLTAAGKWGSGDSYKIINDDKPAKNLFGRKR